MHEQTKLILITDRHRIQTPLPAFVDRALAGAPPGTTAIQLREKDLSGGPLAELARALLPICRRHGAPLLVNERIDVALAVGADGVHLPSIDLLLGLTNDPPPGNSPPPQSGGELGGGAASGPGLRSESLEASVRRLLGTKLLGVSCHSIAAAAAAHESGADYVVFGPLYDTPSKRSYGPPLGLDPLSSAAALGIPIFGLGGVTPARVNAVLSAGAAGVAAIGAWMDATDPAEAVRSLLSRLETTLTVPVRA